MRPSLVCLPLALLWASASAGFSVPFDGWQQQAPGTWQSAGGQCVIREDLHDQTFAPPTSQARAAELARGLQNALSAKKFSAVTAQPLERGGSYALLAAYVLTSGGSRYQVTQLYLSQGGKLRTLTGSALAGETDKCAADIQNYLHYLAY